MSLLKVLLFCGLVVNCAIQSTIGFKAKLTILHFNDLNSQLMPYEKGDPSAPGKWGGLPSLVELLKNETLVSKNPVRIAAGNLIGGESGWLPILGWDEFGKLVPKYYNPDVMGLGFKEFEAGLSMTNTYLEQWPEHGPLVNNVKCTGGSGEQEKKFCSKRKTSHVIELPAEGGNPVLKVGVVGFVNPLVEKLADPDSLTFDQDVPDALDKALQANEFSGINTFIAVGSGSMDIARDILTRVSKIKIVVLSGSTYDMKPELYPTKQGDGLIVKAGPYGKNFGKLVVEVDSAGGVTVTSDSKLVDNNGGQDSDALQTVTAFANGKIKNATDTILGTTLVKLESTKEKCWKTECNLGNLIADAMVHCALQKKFSDKPDLADLIGIWTSGSIFNDIHEPGKNITEFDVHKFLPYHNRVYIVAVKGSTLKTIFETSGGAINAPGNGNKEWGQFLQVSSGIDVKYGTDGSLKSLRVHHLEDSQPVLMEVDDTKLYHIVLPSFMARGRSVYDYIPKYLEPDLGGDKLFDIGFDDECVHNYVNGLKVLSVGFEQRITISDDSSGCGKCSKGNTGVTVFLTLLIFLLIVGLVYVGWRFVWPRISNRPHTSHFP